MNHSLAVAALVAACGGKQEPAAQAPPAIEMKSVPQEVLQRIVAAMDEFNPDDQR